MAEIQARSSRSLIPFTADLSPVAQAQVVIPIGTVRNINRYFEAEIANHRYETDQQYIQRALRNVDSLIRTNRTHASQLRVVDALSLSHLPTSYINFLRDYNNVYRTAIRSRRATRVADRNWRTVDVLKRVQLRIVNMRNVYSLEIIQDTRHPGAWRRMQDEGQFDQEIRQVSNQLENEIVRVLTILELLLPSPTEDPELENIGPDHKIEDFGFDIQASPLGCKRVLQGSLGGSRVESIQAGRPTCTPVLGVYELETLEELTTGQIGADCRDHTRRCCICMEAYTHSHPAFLIRQCGHIVGKPCLTTWLNSTARNANLCPHCRTPLCERRPRRPISHTLDQIRARRTLEARFKRACDLLRMVSQIYVALYGGVGAKQEWFDRVMRRLNERFFGEGVGFIFVGDEGVEGGWRLRRADWGRTEILD